MLKADITEIFSSIQGEGIFVGFKQIFVRFKRCNLNCCFCDVSPSLIPREYSIVELIDEIEALEASHGPHHSISLTGGEPLLYAEYLQGLTRTLKEGGFKLYLETNGTLPEYLLKVVDFIDVIAMDFKLPSSTSQGPFWKEHLEFLSIAKSKKKNVFVKVVVTAETNPIDLSKAIELVKEAGEEIPFILQPATLLNSNIMPTNTDLFLEFLRMAMKEGLKNERIIPQVHKILEVR